MNSILILLALLGWYLVLGLYSIPLFPVGPVKTIDHQSCFTEGLVLCDGNLYESCGGYNSSTVRILSASLGKVMVEVSLPHEHFAEGLTIHGSHVFVTTWTQRIIHVLHVESLSTLGKLTFTNDRNQGWGLTTNNHELIMSDGSSVLYFYEVPKNVSEERELVLNRKLKVYSDSHISVTLLNELEYVDGSIFANIWLSDIIVKIDAETGEVTRRYNISNLSKPNIALSGVVGKDLSDVVPNGIAYCAQDGSFVLTGKLWPHHFFVHLPYAVEAHTNLDMVQTTGVVTVVLLLGMLWLYIAIKAHDSDMQQQLLLED